MGYTTASTRKAISTFCLDTAVCPYEVSLCRLPIMLQTSDVSLTRNLPVPRQTLSSCSSATLGRQYSGHCSGHCLYHSTGRCHGRLGQFLCSSAHSLAGSAGSSLDRISAFGRYMITHHTTDGADGAWHVYSPLERQFFAKSDDAAFPRRDGDHLPPMTPVSVNADIALIETMYFVL